MIRNYLWLLLAICSLSTFAQGQDVPAVLKAPADCTPVLHAFAKGVQIYICTQDPADTSRYQWTFSGPRADLYAQADYRTPIGKHYLNAAKQPTWQVQDGSSISGAKLEQANSPDSLAIPWLLLKAVAPGGTGKLRAVAYIQRINTKGGKAPATAQAAQRPDHRTGLYGGVCLFYQELALCYFGQLGIKMPGVN